MTRLTSRIALALLAAGALRCGAPEPAPDPALDPGAPGAEAAALSVEGEVEDVGTERTVRCGDSLTSYWGISDSATAYSQTAAKRICRQKLVNRVNKRTSCDKGSCGGGTCRANGNVRSTTYECRPSGSDFYCRCRPTTVVYACSSCG